MASLRQWRLAHVGDDGNMSGRLAEIERRLQQFEAAQADPGARSRRNSAPQNAAVKPGGPGR